MVHACKNLGIAGVCIPFVDTPLDPHFKVGRRACLENSARPYRQNNFELQPPTLKWGHEGSWGPRSCPLGSDPVRQTALPFNFEVGVKGGKLWITQSPRKRQRGAYQIGSPDFREGACVWDFCLLDSCLLDSRLSDFRPPELLPLRSQVFGSQVVGSWVSGSQVSKSWFSWRRVPQRTALEPSSNSYLSPRG